LVANIIVLGIGIATMFLFSTGTISVTTSVLAATVNCNLAVQECIGTNSADTMFVSNLKGGAGAYFVDPKGGDDTFVANVEVGKVDPGISGFISLASGGNDKISVKSTEFFSTTEFYGGDGSDKITYSGAKGVKLFQAEFENTPDGDKDTLNCGNAVDSTAFISLEDGDVAVNCETVKTQPNP
jgi:hypothetical protein